MRDGKKEPIFLDKTIVNVLGKFQNIGLVVTKWADHSFCLQDPVFIGGAARLFDFAGTLNTYNMSATGELADTRAFQED